jgi:hypothetical protein
VPAGTGERVEPVAHTNDAVLLLTLRAVRSESEADVQSCSVAPGGCVIPFEFQAALSVVPPPFADRIIGVAHHYGFNHVYT